MSDVINAAKTGDLASLKRLFQQNKGILNHTDGEGYFALYWAACCGHEDVCRYLLQEGANVDQTVRTGSTALHAAADRGHLHCVHILVNSNCDVNLQNYNNFDTPLHLAAYRGHLDICRLLAESGASLTIKNTHGRAPSDEASAQQHFGVTCYLHDCWEEERKQYPRTTTTVRGRPTQTCSHHKRTLSDPKFSYPKSTKACEKTENNRTLTESNQQICNPMQTPLCSINSSNREGTLNGDCVDGYAPLISGQQPTSNDSQKSSVDYFPVQQNYSTDTNFNEDICHDKNQPVILPQQETVPTCANHASGFNLPNITQEEVNIPHHRRTIFNPIHPHGNLFEDRLATDRSTNPTGLTVSNIPMSKYESDTSTSSNNSSSYTDSEFSRLSSAQHIFHLVTQSQIDNTSSQNFPSAPKANPYFKQSRQTHDDYITSLELQVTTQRDRISFLENKNAILWQECEDLRASNAGDKQQLKHNHKLQEQVHVLLQEVDELRQQLKSSESRSKHLAKQLFRHQNNNSRSFENNTNQQWPSAGYTEVNYGSRNIQIDSLDKTLISQKDRQQFKKAKRSKGMQEEKSPPRSPSPSSSSASSGSRGNVSPVPGSHVALIDALGPVFMQAGQCFLTSVSDNLRQAVINTLPEVKEKSLDLAGKRWQMGEDFLLVDDEPINEISPGEIEGACSLVYRIKHNDCIYILKMMINLVNLARGGHDGGQSGPLFLFQQFSAEYTIPFSLPPHRNIIQVLHNFNAATVDFRGALQKVIPAEFDVPIDMANETSFIVLPEYSTTLKRLVDRRQEIARKSGLLVSPSLHLPEEFIAQKLFEVLSAVNHLSENKIAHRDIKADNVFLDQTLSAVLGDFGMARNLRAPGGEPIPFVESGQVIAGNSLAWAPELIHWHSRGPSQDSDAKVLDDVYAYSDVYAVGVMFMALISPGAVDPLGTDLQSSQISTGFTFILQRLVAPLPSRFSAMKALTMIGIHMFGPEPNEVSSEDKCRIWLQAKMMKLLVCQNPNTSERFPSDSTCTVQSSTALMRDLLEREYITKVQAGDLFACYQEYCSAISDSEAVP